MVLREVADVTYADADKIVLVMDNLNTHKLAVLYQVYPPEEARRLYERFEVHHTPKHASWLNMAETELSVLGRQCLDRRIAHQDLLRREVAAWEAQTESGAGASGLAVHHRRRPYQTETALPETRACQSRWVSPLGAW